MTDSTTTEDHVPAPAAASAAEPAKPARRWNTLTLAIVSVIALVLGLGIGGVSGWAIAQAQRPQFSFQGGPGGDGDFQPPGDGQFQQRGDGTSEDDATS